MRSKYSAILVMEAPNIIKHNAFHGFALIIYDVSAVLVKAARAKELEYFESK